MTYIIFQEKIFIKKRKSIINILWLYLYLRGLQRVGKRIGGEDEIKTRTLP